MRSYNYKNKWQKLLTPEVVSLLTQIHEYKGEQTLFIEAKADTLTQLVEIAKIYCDNDTTGSLILNTFHASEQYAKMRIKFVNGSYSDVDIIENVGTDNYYISKNKTNNVYTVYIDMHSNVNEWIGANVEKGTQLNHLNAINLDIQMENGNRYSPNKINYNADTLDTLI